MPMNRATPFYGLPRELSIVVADDSSGTAVVAVSGEIDISNFGKFHAAASSALVDRSQLILDLSGVTFIDSAGVNVLVAWPRARPPSNCAPRRRRCAG